MRRSIDLLLLSLAAVLAVLAFGLLPRLVTPSLALDAGLVVLMAATAQLHYGLMHETMHGNIFESEAWNRRVGRLLGITLGLPFETMRFGHLAHHGFNRHDYDRPESLHDGETWRGKAPGYYFQLVIGNDLLYALAPLVLLLPMSMTPALVARMNQSPDMEWFRKAALRTFSNPKRRRDVRIDILAVVALFGFALWAWGASWPVFVACIFARWSVLSILDNAPHYGMPLDSGLDARNTRFPAIVRWLILNQNFHGEHHRAPQTHWQELPAAFAASGAAQHGSWFAAQARQFVGPVRLPEGTP